MTENLGGKWFLIVILCAASALLVTPPTMRPEPVRDMLARFWIHLGLDLSGGAELRLQVPKDEAKRRGISVSEAVDDCNEVIEKRIHDSGIVKDAAIRRQGEDMLLIQLPGITESELDEIKRLITELGSIEFRILAQDPITPAARVVDGKMINDPPTTIAAEREAMMRARTEGADYAPPAGYAWHPVAERSRHEFNGESDWLVQLDNDNWTGEKLQRIASDTDSRTLSRIVLFEIRGAVNRAKFGVFTEKNIGRRMAIVFNNQIVSAPTIQSKLPGQGQITGMTDEEVATLTKILKSGSLSVQPKQVSTNFVGPSLGQYTIDNSQHATVVAFALVVAFMLVYYMQAGLIANIALTLNLLFIVALLVLFGATLTLPGIAGIVLTLGMAVDANIIIYERIREEKALGNALLQSVEAGFDRALSSIVDSNLTTVISGVVLYYLGSGAVKGFAVTLLIGIATTLFTALFVSKALFGLCLRHAPGLLGTLPMLDVVGKPNLPFTRYGRHAMAGSAIAIVAGLVLFSKTESLSGVEMKGGTIVEIALAEPLEADVVRQAIPEAFRAEVQESKLLAGGDPRTQRKFSITVRNVDFDVLLARHEQIARDLDAFLTAERGEAWLESQKRTQLETDRPSDASTELGALLRFTTMLAEAKKLGLLAPDAATRSVEHVALVPPTDGEPPVKTRVRDYLGRITAEEISPVFFRFTLAQAFAKQLVPEGIGVPQLVEGTKRYRVALAFEQPFTLDAIEARVKASGEFPQAIVTLPEGKTGPTSRDFVLEVSEPVEPDLRAVPARVAKIQDAATLFSEPFPTSTSIGNLVAKHQQRDAFYAMVLATAGMLLYISIRFRFVYGLAAVICLVHDVLFTLGAVALFGGPYWGGQPLVNIEMNLTTLAAFLSIVGYSVNDTIIVFDRFRENMNKPGRHAFEPTANAAINQTLARTTITSFATFITVAVMFVLNYQKGGVVEGFSFAMMFGIVIGTYSSIFVATPILVEWHNREEAKIAAEAAKSKGTKKE